MTKKEDFLYDFCSNIIENKYKILEDFCKAYLASKDIQDVKALKELLSNDRITLVEEFKPPKIIYSLSINLRDEIKKGEKKWKILL